MAYAVDAFDGIDVLVNNAGVSAFGYVSEIAPQMWERVIAVTLSSVFDAEPRRFAASDRARRLHRQYRLDLRPWPGDVGFAVYNAAKGGVVNLTRALAIDHASDGVRVNAICPGVTGTGSTAWMRKHSVIMDSFEERLPMGRTGRPEEIAGAIAFLASEDASYITGINLVVDGGLSACTGQPAFRKLVETAVSSFRRSSATDRLDVALESTSIKERKLLQGALSARSSAAPRHNADVVAGG